MTDYGRAARIARASLGLSQEEMASRAGISKSHLSLVESGQRGLSTGAVDRLAHAAGISASCLASLGADLGEVDPWALGQALARLIKTAA